MKYLLDGEKKTELMAKEQIVVVSVETTPISTSDLMEVPGAPVYDKCKSVDFQHVDKRICRKLFETISDPEEGSD